MQEALPLAPIVGLCRDDPAHPTTRVVAVAVIAGDQMNVQMWHGLTGRRTVVDADVVRLRPKLKVDACSGAVKQSQQIKAFVGRKVKKRPGVALWDDERVPGGQWIGITYHKAVEVAVDSRFAPKRL